MKFRGDASPNSGDGTTEVQRSEMTGQDNHNSGRLYNYKIKQNN